MRLKHATGESSPGVHIKAPLTTNPSLPPRPVSPIQKPSGEWCPSEVQIVNDTDDKEKRNKMIGAKHANIILGKSLNCDSNTGSQIKSQPTTGIRDEPDTILPDEDEGMISRI